MGWKGTMRSVRAEIRRAEKRQVQYAKMQQAEDARNLVSRQNDLIEDLKSIHKVFAEKINWNDFITAPEPICPIRRTDTEDNATKRYMTYQPGFLIKLLKLVEWRRSQLKNKIEQAKAKDEALYLTALSSYKVAHAQWRKDKDFAEQICAGDLTSYEQTIMSKSVFTGGSLKCSALSFKFEEGVLVVEADVLSDSHILPDKIYSVTKTGKLSEKDFPVTQYNQLYQDYVCSASLGVAKVILGIFPIDRVLVHAMAEVLNKSTGNLERQPLLSVFIPASTLNKINLDNVDPSDCMKNFNHNMEYKNTEGLNPTCLLSIKNGQAS